MFLLQSVLYVFEMCFESHNPELKQNNVISVMVVDWKNILIS